MKTIPLRVLTALLMVLSGAEAFVTKPASFGVVQQSDTTTTGSSSSLQMTVLSYKGKKKNFPPGSPLSKACAALGVPVKYSCRKGDCATCQINIGGRFARACIGKVPPEPKLKSLQEKGIEIK